MFVRPFNLRLRERFTISWCRRWISNLRDKVGCRSLGNTINKESNQRDFYKQCEAKCKAKENAFTIKEPLALLVLGKLDAAEIGLELQKVC